MSDLLLLTLNLIWAALALFFLATIGKTYRYRQQLPDASADSVLPKLSLIIPARDEANNIGECLQCITQLEYPEGALEVIVVDDNSGDATAAIVSEFAQRDSRIQLISADPLPEGWMGKSHACWQGVAAASGEWLLFVDADTYLKPTAARDALAYALSNAREFLSVIPFQQVISFQERIALPGVFLGFATAIDFDRVNDPDDSYALANGQFLLFSRSAYQQIGGHEAIRGETSDDLAFARAIKAAHIGGYTLFGDQQIETRMYRSLGAIWRGFSKNAIEIMHATSTGRCMSDALRSLLLSLGTLLPIATYCATPETASMLQNATLTLSIVTLASLLLIFTLALHALRIPVIYLLALPFGLALHGAIIINAYLRQKTGKREWKGRHY
ncbi:hypothetical protein BOW53_13125 [Solemya pervernicosa gill symbiont]|uniref:Glycosyltransferase 2-like domain-containing protein n=2 Tax=Gammaproteobacteria incertae sedis TaxID=118884 RepID=A0A1T2L1X4_9GAMM|nr:glycosyltransferase [Candidatus Reidiella endopervernicosa]OOZ39071.1 hypothetical protein BOW53_13125 [Solemya pervernicosa gill symbiont]QKQ25161.1 glycosyltransferase [Candidatus Reidiella endopervernicosa]